MKFDVGIMNNQPVPAIVRQVQLAERLGFATAWITDSHLVCRELWVTLTACALDTSRIRLGPGVTVPHTRHASVTASAIATLHDLAAGRLVLGLGTGGSSAETMAMSVQRAARVATLETMTGAIRRLVARETTRFESGVDGRLAWLEHSLSIPLYVAGSGPCMLRAAGRLGDGALMYVGTAPEILRAGLAHVADGAREGGRRLADLDVALWPRTRPRGLGHAASATRGPLARRPGRGAATARSLRFLSARHRRVPPPRAGARPLRGSHGSGRDAAGGRGSGPPGCEREEILTTFADEVMAKI